MKKPEDILKQSIEALAKTDVPPGPPPELIEATVAKLAAAAGPPAFLRKQEGCNKKPKQSRSPTGLY